MNIKVKAVAVTISKISNLKGYLISLIAYSLVLFLFVPSKADFDNPFIEEGIVSYSEIKPAKHKPAIIVQIKSFRYSCTNYFIPIEWYKACPIPPTVPEGSWIRIFTIKDYFTAANRSIIAH